MAKTKIEWADMVWNPTVGCTKISQGCKNCYAERIYLRFNPDKKFSNVQCYPERLDQPFHWKKPCRIFVDSMSDLFHEKVPDEFIKQVFTVMISADWHKFLILTKRPRRMQKIIERYPIYKSENIWLGVSVEDQKTANERIPWLLKTPAAVYGVSVEPMLEKIDLKMMVYFCGGSSGLKDSHPDWVICGCESGPTARPMDLDWARSLRDQCQAANVPFFLKQAVINGKLIKMPELDGKQWMEYPNEHD